MLLNRIGVFAVIALVSLSSLRLSHAENVEFRVEIAEWAEQAIATDGVPRPNSWSELADYAEKQASYHDQVSFLATTLAVIRGRLTNEHYNPLVGINVKKLFELFEFMEEAKVPDSLSAQRRWQSAREYVADTIHEVVESRTDIVLANILPGHEKYLYMLLPEEHWRELLDNAPEKTRDDLTLFVLRNLDPGLSNSKFLWGGGEDIAYSDSAKILLESTDNFTLHVLTTVKRELDAGNSNFAKRVFTQEITNEHTSAFFAALLREQFDEFVAILDAMKRHLDEDAVDKIDKRIEEVTGYTSTLATAVRDAVISHTQEFESLDAVTGLKVGQGLLQLARRHDDNSALIAAYARGHILVWLVGAQWPIANM